MILISSILSAIAALLFFITITILLIAFFVDKKRENTMQKKIDDLEMRIEKNMIDNQRKPDSLLEKQTQESAIGNEEMEQSI